MTRYHNAAAFLFGVCIMGIGWLASTGIQAGIDEHRAEQEFRREVLDYLRRNEAVHIPLDMLQEFDGSF